ADRARFGFAAGRIRPTGGLPAIGGEPGKIMSADEMFRGGLDYCEIERSRDVPGTAILERRQNGRGPDSVAINFSLCRKTRMKILRHISTAKHTNGGRQERIERSKPTGRL